MVMKTIRFLLILTMILAASCSMISFHPRALKHHSLRINAVLYDAGGEGIGYHDTTLKNSGKTYRKDDVDIQICQQGGYEINSIEKGEWLRFSQVPGNGGKYYASALVASDTDKGAFQIKVNGATAREIKLPRSKKFQTWKIVNAGTITLPQGLNTIRIVSLGDNWKLRWIHFHSDKKEARLLRKTKLKSEKKNPRTLITLTDQALKSALDCVGDKDLKKVDTAAKQKSLVKALTHRKTLDKLKAAHIPIEFITMEIPYKYILPGFMDRLDQGVPLKPGGEILVNDGYHDHTMIQNLVHAFHESYPGITSLQSIGKTWQNRDIWALKISDNPSTEEDEPAFLFVGSHHANELLSSEHVLDIIETLLLNNKTDERVKKWVDTYEIWCIPLANPDGLYRFFHVCGSGRKNGRDTNLNRDIDVRDGVDLNRNYPFRWNTLGEKGSKSYPLHWWYRGPEAASEPEVKAIMRLSEAQRFIMLISFHTSATKILVPYTIDDVKNPEPSLAWSVGEKLAELSESGRKDRKYKAVRNLYSVDGTDQDWHYWKYGTLAYIWEGARHNPPYEKDRDRMVEGIRNSWGFMLDRMFTGPTISGNVQDAETGEPLEAEIAIQEISTFEAEIHTSHPQTGRFDKLLPFEGIFHLVFQKSGYVTEKIEVSVGKGWKQGLVVKMKKISS